MTAVTEQNKQLVRDFWRLCLQARNIALAEQYLAPDYIQHNPTVPTGRDGFVMHFGAIARQVGGPFPPEPDIRNLVLLLAQDDYVTVVRREQVPEPEDPQRSYEAFKFDVFRVENGRLAEHWDGARK